MDPTALRWKMFAADQSHARSPDLASTSQPPAFSFPTPSPIVRREPLPNNNNNNFYISNNHSSNYSNNHSSSSSHSNYNNHDCQELDMFKTNRELNRHKVKKRLDEEGLESFRKSPTYCFCKKEAVRVYTAEYGPILECGLYDEASKVICGFHVHELAWTKFQRIVENGHAPFHDHIELSTCPFFNFTFCTMFKVDNGFECIAPSLPLCFCNRPVIQTAKIVLPNDDDYDDYEDYEEYNVECLGTTEIGFQCKNADIDGAKPKCSWYLTAKRSALPKSKYRLHSIIDQERYFNIRQETLDHIQFIKSANKKMYDDDDDDDDFKMIENNNSSNSSGSEDYPTTSNSFSKHRLLPTSLIPTSVMRKRPLVTTKANHEPERIALKADINRMREELAQKRSLYEKMEKESHVIEGMKNEIENCQTIKYRMEKEQDTRMTLLLLSRQRVKAIESELSDIEIRKLQKDTQHLEMKEDDVNCKKCRERRIEYAVAPCFHFAYCETCALDDDLKECVVCGEHIKHIQKMYMC